MDLFSIYNWITSFLRPRGVYATKEDQHKLRTSTDDTTNNNNNNNNTASKIERTVNCIEFIPTLNFIIKTDLEEVQEEGADAAATLGTFDAQHAVATYRRHKEEHNIAAAATADNNAIYNELRFTCYDNLNTDDDDDKHSSHTFIIDTGTNSLITEENEEVILAEEGLQEVDLSLTHDTSEDPTSFSISISSFFCEPTSSISIQMEGKSTTATTTPSSDKSAIKSNTPRTTTSTRSHSSSNENNSIEEEIEEALESSVASTTTPTKNNNNDSKDKLLGAVGKRQKDEMFGIQISELSDDDDDDENKDCAEAKIESSKSQKEESENAGDRFSIDDDQLSGGQLAQHFVIDEDNDDHEEQVDKDLSKDISKVPKQALLSENNDKLKSLHELTSVEQEKHDSEDVEEESLANQSTTNDVSDLMDEPNNEVIGASAKLPKETKSPEMKSTHSSSSHSEKDNSIDEMMASNQRIEITLEDPENISSINHSYLEHNATLINQLLEDFTEPQREDDDEFETKNRIITDLDENVLEIDEKQNVPLRKLPPIESTNPVKITSSQAQEDHKLTPLSVEVEVDDPGLGMQEAEEDEEEDVDNSLQLMKLRIMAMKHQVVQSGIEMQLSPHENSEIKSVMHGVSEQHVRPMERVPMNEFSKEILEDITEESERNSLSVLEVQSLSRELSAHSDTLLHEADQQQQQKTEDEEVQEIIDTSGENVMVPVKLLQRLENKIIDLQSILHSKDACLAALNMQLDAAMQRRESCSGAPSGDQMGSGRDTSSIVTNSTEYRTLQEDLGLGPTIDIYIELSKRDELIAKLTDSLQQSVNVREQLQLDSDKLTGEVQQLRKQLTDAMDSMRRPIWSRDQESNGQRISEISMDLISESDDGDIERQFLTDNEEKYSRNSRERQFSLPRQYEPMLTDLSVHEQLPFNMQIEQFQKYLTPSEVRLFFMVRKKFDDFLSQELEKSKMKSEQEYKLMVDQLENDKLTKQEEIKKLMEQRQQVDALHSKEMEDLRKYFENKCADLEKQFSDDVFSQKSQHHNGDTSSDNSDQEPLIEDVASPRRLLYKSLSREIAISTGSGSANTSPRKRSRAELLLSPSHRQMTPSTDAFMDDEIFALNKNQNVLEVAEMKIFYQNKLRETQRVNEENMRKLTDRLKYYESRYPEEEFMNTSTDNRSHAKIEEQDKDEQIQVQNTSLIIIDQDELIQQDDESQVIKKIIEEYERRLQEQLELARADIERELVERIQTLSEGNVDDQHWPSSLILLREKFTAKTQLEIAHLQIKHEEEMSRLKLEHEKQLKRKNLRHTTFDSARDRSIDHVLSERDSLRELSRTLRFVLSRLAHCVLSYEDDLNATLLDEVQRVLHTAADHSVSHQLQNASTALLNSSLNASMGQVRRLAPDVQQLLQLVDAPHLVDYVDQRSFANHSLTLNSDRGEDFDLQECLMQLRSEAEKLLILSEKMQTDSNKEELLRQRHYSESSISSGGEKHDSCPEKSLPDNPTPPPVKTQRAHSLNEPSADMMHDKTVPLEMHSLPHDLQRYAVISDGGTPTVSSTTGDNASELNLQLHELKNRLVKSEYDRVQMQQQLENTISRNTELGQQLQNLRDQFSQLNSLNTASHIEYAQGYGLGSLKSAVERLSSVADKIGNDMSANNSDGTLSPTSSFVQLQQKARQLLTITPTSDECEVTIKSSEQQSQQAQQLQQSQPSLDQSQQSLKRGSDATVILLQMIEDFCREGDEIVEHNKKDRYNLQAQIDNADKQLKATRQFLEDQAAEREQERDEYLREIEQLKLQLRDKLKELSSYRNTSEEVEQLEQQIKELTENLHGAEAKHEKVEVDLKASIDKIIVLRDIIASLEAQVDQKTLEENVLQDKVQELNSYLAEQLNANNALQNEVQHLKDEISNVYKQHINSLEEKLQNARPATEQSMLLQQVAEQLADIERSLTEKTQILESLHHAISSNSCSISVTEDVSVASNKPPTTNIASRDLSSPEAQGSPVHPSPRMHSITMEAVQRIADKLSKHTRVEEAAIKRIRDLEMQIKQMREFFADLQQERDALQERMHEQTQRISTLQMRLEEQRHRAEELQRTGTSDLNIRVHDLTGELQNLRELLESRDKQILTLKQQLDKSKQAIDRLEAELQVEQHPDRSLVERLEQEVKQKDAELQTFKERMKSQMINKLALPDLMETMLADKNEEIDHLKEQLDAKEKQLQQYVLDLSQGSSAAGGIKAQEDAAGGSLKPLAAESSKFSARTLSDIVSISEFDEPDVVRRAVIADQITPLQAPQPLENTGDLTKNQCVENISDYGGKVRQAHTFEHPYYFQDAQLLAAQSSGSINSPALVPRQINFSVFTEDSKHKTSSLCASNQQQQQQGQLQPQQSSNEELQKLQHEFEILLKNRDKLQQNLSDAEEELSQAKVREQELLNNVADLRVKSLQATEQQMSMHNALRQELQALSEAHKIATEKSITELQQLETEIRNKDEKLLLLSVKLSAAEQQAEMAQLQINSMEVEIERLRAQQPSVQQTNSDNSSRQFSVDEIARQVEKELNYSVQLDTNILKAIESEEENNLDRQEAAHKDVGETPDGGNGTGAITGTDDENFTGERELLNQLAVLRAQIVVERERNEEIHAALLSEQQHSHEIQEQDVDIIQNMRQRLEAALQDKDQLMQQLDIERERVEHMQAQITSWQRAESRRNSAASLKSPVESPRRSARLQLENSEALERLRAELKLMTAQNEREHERLEDMQRAQERERARYIQELQERQEYSESMQKKQQQLLLEKQTAEDCCEHLQERLTLQTQEIESLEARITALQEAETRRSLRREKLQRENAQLVATIQQMKTEQMVAESEQQELRMQLERGVVREHAMAEALGTAQQNMLNAGTRPLPAKFVQDLERFNSLLEWNTRENMKMSDKVQDLVEDREHLQRERDELRAQAGANVTELEERCQHLFGRYRRVESHRKALVYQKRYLKISLDSYKDKLTALTGVTENVPQQAAPRDKKKLFKTVALAIIAIKRMKYIVHIWQTGKRTVLKSIVTITQQKRSQPLTQNNYNGLVVINSSNARTTPTNTLSSDENNYNNNNYRSDIKNEEKLQQFYVLTKNNNNNINNKKNIHLHLQNVDYPLTSLEAPAILRDCGAVTKIKRTNNNGTNVPQILIDCPRILSPDSQ